jgi:hypothetical protein
MSSLYLPRFKVSGLLGSGWKRNSSVTFKIFHKRFVSINSTQQSPVIVGVMYLACPILVYCQYGLFLRPGGVVTTICSTNRVTSASILAGAPKNKKVLPF